MRVLFSIQLPLSTAGRVCRNWAYNGYHPGADVRTFSGHIGITSVAFSPDGKYVLIGSDDSTAKLWDSDYLDVIDCTCAHLTRDLTPDERIQQLVTGDTPTCP